MFALLLLLTPIALLDSTSIVPLCLVILIALLAGSSPLLGSLAHIAGVFAVYFACGLLLLIGLQSAFDQINAYAVRIWNDPATEELVVQIVLGLLACGFGWRMARGRAARREGANAGGMTPARAFAAGAGLTVVGLPGAVPYFAAIDLILRAESGLQQQLAALLFYNLVFVLPLAAIVALRLALGARSLGLLTAVKRALDRWGGRVIGAALALLGCVLVADGVGWFLGQPLLPI